MQVIHDYKELLDPSIQPVIALGNFDGVHKGHKVVIDTAINIAKQQGKPSAVMTFEPHPISLFKPEVKNYRLTSLRQKAEMLESLGIDYLYVINFDREFSKITAVKFIEGVLLNNIKASHVVTGHDYIFGHKKGGDTQMLQEYADKLGYGYTCVDAVGGEEIYSSTQVRNALKDAKLGKVVEVLGRNYVVDGIVVRGDNRGKSIGFPTINVDSGEHVRPCSGVYAVKVRIENDASVLDGVANIGVKPTFDGTQQTMEVHIFDFSQDIYGKNVSVEFLRYIRAERKFQNADELVQQIEKDCIAARG